MKNGITNDLKRIALVSSALIAVYWAISTIIPSFFNRLLDQGEFNSDLLNVFYICLLWVIKICILLVIPTLIIRSSIIKYKSKGHEISKLSFLMCIVPYTSIYLSNELFSNLISNLCTSVIHISEDSGSLQSFYIFISVVAVAAAMVINYIALMKCDGHWIKEIDIDVKQDSK